MKDAKRFITYHYSKYNRNAIPLKARHSHTLTIWFGSFDVSIVTARGMCNTMSHKNSMMPAKSATVFLLKLMIKESPVPINAMPATYVQNSAPGIHVGTSVFTKSVYKK